MAELIVSPEAVDDVDAIHDFIHPENAVAADRVQGAILNAFELLAHNPAIGRLKPYRRHPKMRLWPLTEFPNYIIYYRELVDGNGVEIVRVFHGARNIDAILNK